MWVFGFGSLMWDDWEADRACLGCMRAKLRAYARRSNDLVCREVHATRDEAG